jgi:phospholipase D family protein
LRNSYKDRKKLCLINDTFATLGSANINARSMQIDSELNVDVAVESQPASYKISCETWGWYTNGYEEMNPGGS